ncbi:putrescine aminotransferase [Saccharothrix carnea]|uniref:Putrescine aminotransferase n=1 Tax=Saccharothrix carnea TaxID=1280637 RepID=A0A2P8I4I2_SACCR|nr:aspartate aminotransferase family protein [Saccharothrix carnea]PSL53386.1 putrescine aminotransferase [Saccharothrix carnea]
MTISSALPTQSASATELAGLDRKFLVHPHQRMDRNDRVVIVRGDGALVWDAAGNELIDATGGGNWLSQVGHGRRELADAAAEQIATLEYYTGFFDYSNDKAIELAYRLNQLSPEGIDRVFLTSGGSDSVESAIKSARLYHNRRGEPDRTWILARHFGYHGASYGSGTATGFEMMQTYVGPNLPNVEKLSPVWPYHHEMYGGGDVTDALIAELEATIERIGAGNIAAMIGEPVMAGGGVHEPPADYWPRVREVLSRNGILLIADEVVTGFGRTGSWFDSAPRGMQPDMITIAKGLTSGYIPMGGLLMSDAIAEVVTSNEGFFHGYTYAGHPVAAAVALANLEIIEKENLVSRALTVGEWFKSSLAPAIDLPQVGDVRVVGATVGIELVVSKETKQPMGIPIVAEGVADAVRREHNVIVRPYGNVIVMSPPLVIGEDQVRRTAEATIEVLSRLGADGQVAPR